MGIDYGTVRIGLAISDPRQTIASSMAQYQPRGPEADAQFWSRLAREERVAGWVIGLPVHLSGEESGMSYQARQFAAWLGELTGLPVALVDERFTSAQAEELLQAAGLTSKKRKARRDQLAAQILLAGYLESRPVGEDPGGLDDRRR